MAVHQHLHSAVSIALRLLEDGELIGIDGFILMNTSLDMPTRKVAAIAARERPRSKAAHGNTLPVVVVDISGRAGYAGILEWEPQRALPCGLGNGIAAKCIGSR